MSKDDTARAFKVYREAIKNREDHLKKSERLLYEAGVRIEYLEKALKTSSHEACIEETKDLQEALNESIGVLSTLRSSLLDIVKRIPTYKTYITERTVE